MTRITENVLGNPAIARALRPPTRGGVKMLTIAFLAWLRYVRQDVLDGVGGDRGKAAEWMIRNRRSLRHLWHESISHPLDTMPTMIVTSSPHRPLDTKVAGQGLVEYAMILALVVLVVFVVLTLLGPRISVLFSEIAAALGKTYLP